MRPRDQEAESPGFGVGHDAGSIGEGFGDYWAATMSQPVSGGYGVTCIADWDSISYTVDVPHCLRRVDTDLTVDDQTGAIHRWPDLVPGALGHPPGLGRTTANTIVLTAQYHFNPSTTFRDAALEVVGRGAVGRGQLGGERRPGGVRGPRDPLEQFDQRVSRDGPARPDREDDATSCDQIAAPMPRHASPTELDHARHGRPARQRLAATLCRHGRLRSSGGRGPKGSGSRCDWRAPDTT